MGRICDAYRTEDIDFTVLLTHIGIEADQQLAALLDPRWGVDLIIGGHSHTLLAKPVEVNGIPIVQAASGTDQIGRFDIMVDTDRNTIDSYTWQLIPITPEYCPEDEELKSIIGKYKRITETKYNRILTRFPERGMPILPATGRPRWVKSLLMPLRNPWDWISCCMLPAASAANTLDRS